jgi:hypothetical protein
MSVQRSWAKLVCTDYRLHQMYMQASSYRFHFFRCRRKLKAANSSGRRKKVRARLVVEENLGV